MTNQKIVDIPISTGKYDEFVNDIINLASNSISSYICVMNVHMLVEAHFKKPFKTVIENADIVIPDGKPITWALRILKKVHQERVAGMDLLPAILRKLEQERLSVFFYGGSSHLLETNDKFIKQKFPALEIGGSYSPPYRILTEEENEEVVARINNSKANVVFVVLGCPKQEKWMASMKGRINAVMIGIGGALPVMVGVQKRAPRWMQEFGLEWLFRLQLEPKRLFKRYAITNSVFIYLLCRELFKKKFSYPGSVPSSW